MIHEERKVYRIQDTGYEIILFPLVHGRMNNSIFSQDWTNFILDCPLYSSNQFYSVEDTVYSLQYNIYNIEQDTVYSLQHNIYSIEQDTVYSLQYNIYSIEQDTVYSLEYSS